MSKKKRKEKEKSKKKPLTENVHNTFTSVAESTLNPAHFHRIHQHSCQSEREKERLVFFFQKTKKKKKLFKKIPEWDLFWILLSLHRNFKAISKINMDNVSYEQCFQKKKVKSYFFQQKKKTDNNNRKTKTISKKKKIKSKKQTSNSMNHQIRRMTITQSQNITNHTHNSQRSCIICTTLQPRFRIS